MTPIFIDAMYAITLGLIIGTMAAIQNPKTKALVYSLPLPITVTMLATGAHITSKNIASLALVISTLWLTYYLYNLRKFHILVADIFATLTYIGLGLVILHTWHIDFWLTVIMFLAGYIIYMKAYKHPSVPESTKRDTISPATKAFGAASIGFVLLRLKDLLQAVVVTFPFSGIFAVIEARRSLRTLSHVVVQNSPAVLALFCTVYALPSDLNSWIRVAIGWVIYLIVLRIIYIVVSRV